MTYYRVSVLTNTYVRTYTHIQYNKVKSVVPTELDALASIRRCIARHRQF